LDRKEASPNYDNFDKKSIKIKRKIKRFQTIIQPKHNKFPKKSLRNPTWCSWFQTCIEIPLVRTWVWWSLSTTIIATNIYEFPSDFLHHTRTYLDPFIGILRLLHSCFFGNRVLCCDLAWTKILWNVENTTLELPNRWTKQETEIFLFLFQSLRSISFRVKFSCISAILPTRNVCSSSFLPSFYNAHLSSTHLLYEVLRYL